MRGSCTPQRPEAVLGRPSALRAVCPRHLYRAPSSCSSERGSVSRRVVAISRSSELTTSRGPRQAVNTSLPSFLPLGGRCGSALPGVSAAPGCHGDGAILEMEVKLGFLPVLARHSKYNQGGWGDSKGISKTVEPRVFNTTSGAGSPASLLLTCFSKEVFVGVTISPSLQGCFPGQHSLRVYVPSESILLKTSA